MKFHLIPVLIALSFNAAGQNIFTSYRNFVIKNQELLFEVVYDSAITRSDAFKIFNNNPILKNVEKFDDFVTGEFENHPVDHKRIGKKWGNTPVLFHNSNFSGKVRVDIKPEKFRVTVLGVGTVANNPYGVDDELSAMALKASGTQIKPSWATESMLGILDSYFLAVFVAPFFNSEKGDDW